MRTGTEWEKLQAAGQGKGRMNPHPSIAFKITGHRSYDAGERMPGGRLGSWGTDHHTFSEADAAAAAARFPIGAMHIHVPPAPCRFEMVFTGPRDMAQERAQLSCPHCYPQTAPAVDNRRTS